MRRLYKACVTGLSRARHAHALDALGLQHVQVLRDAAHSARSNVSFSELPVKKKRFRWGTNPMLDFQSSDSKVRLSAIKKLALVRLFLVLSRDKPRSSALPDNSSSASRRSRRRPSPSPPDTSIPSKSTTNSNSASGPTRKSLFLHIPLIFHTSMIPFPLAAIAIGVYLTYG